MRRLLALLKGNSKAARLLVGAVVTLALGAAGCSSASQHEGAQRGTPTHNHRTFIAPDYAVGYQSLRQLHAAATAAAVLKPTSESRVVYVAGLPFTVTSVKVIATILGRPLPTTIGLREVGTSSTYLAGEPGIATVVSPRSEYLAYLQPFTFGNGPVPGQWVVVGGLQGLYRHEGVVGEGGSRATVPRPGVKSYLRVDPGATLLPGAVSVDDVRTN
jgi:hypothetical protein